LALKAKVMKQFLTILICLCWFFGCGQQRTMDSVSLSQKCDSLRSVYGMQTKILYKNDVPFYVALSYFPELKGLHIIVKESGIKTTLNVRPSIGSLLFRKRCKRTYIIRVNKQTGDSIISFSKLPFNAKIGILGHEFNHIVDYNKRNLGGILKRLISYSSAKTKAEYEKTIDSMTIKKGLGWQLYDWSYYVLYTSNAKQKYKTFKQNIYLKPEDILQLMRK